MSTPITGAQTVIASGDNFTCLSGIAAAPTGDLFLTAGECLEPAGNLVLRVNPMTGAQTGVTRGNNFSCIQGLTVDATGDLFVLNGGCPQSTSLVVGVNPTTGAQTVITQGDHLSCPNDIVVAPGGDLMVTVGPTQRSGCTSSSLLGVVQVNPITGAQGVISSAGQLTAPRGLAAEFSGDLFLANTDTCCGVPGVVIRVNPTTGAQTVVSSLGNFSQPTGITFVHPPPLPIPVPGTECAARGAVCHAALATRFPERRGATAVLRPGPCPGLNGPNCLTFVTIIGNFMVNGTISGLRPGALFTVHVPVITADGSSLGARELACKRANLAGRARCAGSLTEEGVFPRQGDAVILQRRP